MKSEQGLCIYCIHFDVETGSPTYDSDPGNQMLIRCRVGHWEIESCEDDTRSYRKKIETGLSCKDFERIEEENL